METERLFYEDACRRDFTATVLSAGRDEHGSYMLLDRTAFYPEGGGQPADRGTLFFLSEETRTNPSWDKKDQENTERAERTEQTEQAERTAGDSGEYCHVLDVQLVEGGIRHYVDRLPVSGTQTRVRGVIDWERRFDLMQQHSGEHIVSGCIHRRYGYDNVGFHMGEDVITIDLNGLLDREQLAEIEAEVNGWIWEDHETRIFFPDDREREQLSYRSKKELTGEVRLVEFPGADLCACCGLHVKRGGEIGLVKLLSVKHFREGVRIEMVSGRRAFQLLNRSFVENGRISVALSVPPERTMEAVERLQEENYNLRGQILSLQNGRFQLRAEQCRGKGNVLIFENDLDPAQIRKEADAVLDVCGGICAVISLEASGTEERGSDKKEKTAAEKGQAHDQHNTVRRKASGKYAIGERDGDVRALVRELNEALQGRGGGKPFFAQGSLQADREAIETFFSGKHFTVLQ